MPWALLIIATVIAFGLGFLAARLSSGASRRSRELDEELQRNRAELAAYRAQVTSHFSRTAELVNELTSNYRTVYQHLAEGSRVLCDGEGPRLEALQESSALTDERVPAAPDPVAPEPMEPEPMEPVPAAEEAASATEPGESPPPEAR